jgi:hypothetical protein
MTVSAVMRLVMIALAVALVSGCTSFPTAGYGDAERVPPAANEVSHLAQPEAPAESAHSYRNEVESAFKRGAVVVAKVVEGVVTGAAVGAVGGVGLAAVSLVMAGATCLDPAICGTLVVGFAVGGAVIGAALCARAALREIESIHTSAQSAKSVSNEYPMCKSLGRATLR